MGLPAWSPDGKTSVSSLQGRKSRDLFARLGKGKFKRLTRHFAIDTEPTWMPDGKHLLFTSDQAAPHKSIKCHCLTDR